jgi:hypothetical protein
MNREQKIEEASNRLVAALEEAKVAMAERNGEESARCAWGIYAAALCNVTLCVQSNPDDLSTGRVLESLCFYFQILDDHAEECAREIDDATGTG